MFDFSFESGCVLTYYMCMMSDFRAIRQFFETEWTFGGYKVVPVYKVACFKRQFIEEIPFHTLWQLQEILYERTKIFFVLIRCMEDSQLGINVWNV